MDASYPDAPYPDVAVVTIGVLVYFGTNGAAYDTAAGALTATLAGGK